VTFRRFVLARDVDETGVSGTGRVAEGCQFSDGTAVVRWLGAHASTVVWTHLEDAVAVSGHNGLTRVVWLDEEEP
jgi:hypothetical protein